MTVAPQVLTFEHFEIIDERTGHRLLGPYHFTWVQGQATVLQAPSGTGKTLFLKAIAGLLPAPFKMQARITLQRPHEAPHEILPTWLHENALYLPQDALNAWHPFLRIGPQLRKILERAQRCNAKEATTRLFDELAALHFHNPQRIAKAYPCELSGGQLARLCFLVAQLQKPLILLLDEPTSTLDNALAHQLLKAQTKLNEAHPHFCLLVTHQSAHAAHWGRHFWSLTKTHVEPCPAQTVRSTLSASAVRHLNHDAAPRVTPANAPLLVSADAITHTYTHRHGLERHPHTLFENLSFQIYGGEVVAITGASGAGKSTLARLLLGLEAPKRGRIQYAMPLRKAALFQNDRDAVNPYWPLEKIMMEGAHVAPPGFKARLAYWVNALGVDPAWFPHYAHRLSGGQLERVLLARSLAIEPHLLVFDEAFRSLDPSSVSRILEVLLDYKTRTLRRRPMAWILISHDESVVATLADRTLPLTHLHEHS